jgi:general secretion pathway protein I
MARTSARAFSLLEVMVALAILAVGLVSLLQVQSRSAQLAIEAREMSVATMLARSKLYDCQHELLKKGFSIGDYDADGNFDDEGYPKIFWECHGYAPEMPTGDGVGDASSAASMFGGAGATSSGASGSSAAPPGSEMSMGMLAPVIQQMASVMKDSIRELVIIVRWGEGEARQELRVTTHVIDKQPMNRVSQMIQQQSRALGALGGGAGGPGGPGAGLGAPGSAAPNAPAAGIPTPGQNGIEMLNGGPK